MKSMATISRQRAPFPASPLRFLTNAWLVISALVFSVIALAVSILFVIPTPYQVLLPGAGDGRAAPDRAEPQPGKGRCT